MGKKVINVHLVHLVHLAGLDSHRLHFWLAGFVFQLGFGKYIKHYTVFHPISKHLEFHQNPPLRVIIILGVWKLDETPPRGGTPKNIGVGVCRWAIKTLTRPRNANFRPCSRLNVKKRYTVPDDF